MLVRIQIIIRFNKAINKVALFKNDFYNDFKILY